MNYCDNCHELFAVAENGLCPYCNVDDFSEAERCEICGRWIEPGKDRCEMCETAISEAMSYVIGLFNGCDETGVLRGIGDYVEARG